MMCTHLAIRFYLFHAWLGDNLSNNTNSLNHHENDTLDHRLREVKSRLRANALSLELRGVCFGADSLCSVSR